MTAIRSLSLAAALMLAASPAALAQTATDPVTQTDPAAQTAPATGGAEAATGVATTTAGQTYMDQSEVEERLEERGYSSISLELSGDAYTGSAERYGENRDIRVDARTGRVLEPTTLTAEQVRNKLEDEGYENVEDVRAAGDEFTAAATRFGEDVDMRVSAATGNVIDPRELKRDQIVQKLEDDDYSDVKVFDRDRDYGNFFAVAEQDDETYLLEVHPITGEIVNEREENS